MPSRSWLLLLAVPLLGIALFFLLHRGAVPVPIPPQPASPPPPASEQGASSAAKNAPAPISPLAARVVSTLVPEHRIADVEERARLARQIAEARQSREAQPPPANQKAGEPGQEPGLDRNYVRGQLREIMPIVKECYENALEKNPNLEGRLVVHLSIVGEPQVGGLVDSSEVDREGPLGSDPALVECVQESMYAVKLKAPRGGGQVKVSYPIIFRLDGPPDGGEPP